MSMLGPGWRRVGSGWSWGGFGTWDALGPQWRFGFDLGLTVIMVEGCYLVWEGASVSSFLPQGALRLRSGCAGGCGGLAHWRWPTRGAPILTFPQRGEGTLWGGPSSLGRGGCQLFFTAGGAEIAGFCFNAEHAEGTELFLSIPCLNSYAGNQGFTAGNCLVYIHTR